MRPLPLTQDAEARFPALKVCLWNGAGNPKLAMQDTSPAYTVMGLRDFMTYATQITLPSGKTWGDARLRVRCTASYGITTGGFGVGGIGVGTNGGFTKHEIFEPTEVPRLHKVCRLSDN